MKNNTSNTDSNTPRLYSQWLNSAIYWSINHCTDRALTGVTPFGSPVDFHDVIYHIPQTLTIDGVASFLQLLDVQNVRKYMRFSLNNS